MSKTLSHYVNGVHVAGTSGRYGDVYDPADGSVKARVPLASASETAAAVEAAAVAFPAWRDTPPLRRAAVAAALGQSEPILRVVAVRASEPMDPMFSDGLRRGLADPDPRVRGASARRLAEDPDPILALDLARGALRAEEDAYAFRAIHEAMTVLVGTKVELPPGGESDPTVRSKTREAWSRECPE